MAKTNHVSIPAHHNIYSGEHNNRELDIYFSEPDGGANKETGLLLLIPGFGGNSQSNVYKKMRMQFADKHNLIVIQCDYFGSEYMQATNKIKFSMDTNKFKSLLSVQDYNLIRNENNSFDKIIKVLSKYSCVLNVTEDLKEDVSSFNDMGFMQALDLLSALYAVKLILKDNSITYNESKVISYGHSHGAYLAYLCNRLA